MMNKEELLAISGGGVNLTLVAGICISIITFIGGVLDGLSRPLACHK